MRCPSCGGKLSKGESHCTECGRAIDTQVTSDTWHRRIGVVSLLVTAVCLVIVGFLVLNPNALNASGSSASVTNKNTVIDERPVSEKHPQEDQPSPTENHEDAGPEVADEMAEMPVRATVDEYTWEELGKLSRLIARASTDSEGLQIAITYHLCTSDGKIDGSQAKRFTMSDGTEAWAQILGFRHDQKSDGLGMAGLSFITKDCIALHNVNEEDSNTGGWQGSEMRAWLDQEVLPALPDELKNQIVAVNKLTNNVGRTDETSCISETSDMLWLVSMEEIVGVIEKDDWMRSALENGWYPDEATASEAYERLERLAWTILNLEGTQYQLFSDLGLDIYGYNPFLIKTYHGEVVQWWERNPSPGFTNNFHICHRDGSPDNTERPQTVAGVAISFCI